MSEEVTGLEVPAEQGVETVGESAEELKTEFDWNAEGPKLKSEYEAAVKDFQKLKKEYEKLEKKVGSVSGKESEWTTKETEFTKRIERLEKEKEFIKAGVEDAEHAEFLEWKFGLIDGDKPAFGEWLSQYLQNKPEFKTKTSTSSAKVDATQKADPPKVAPSKAVDSTELSWDSIAKMSRAEWANARKVILGGKK